MYQKIELLRLKHFYQSVILFEKNILLSDSVRVHRNYGLPWAIPSASFWAIPRDTPGTALGPPLGYPQLRLRLRLRAQCLGSCLQGYSL